ncbi:MAG: CehA/McbA family metallohydrolase [Planctomycetes bacterium]|nr:CehA/McbA family metallohydrolase [Planctomycetota bacterium]
MKLTPWLVLALLASPAIAAQSQTEVQTITQRLWHLGNDPTPGWTEAPVDPEGSSLEVPFEAHAFEGEGVLFVQQRDVNNTWLLQLNGKPLATLDKSPDELAERFYAIPPGVMREGANTLTLMATNPADDILFGNVRYVPRSIREHFELCPFSVHVSERLDVMLRDVPARITIVGANGELPPIFYAESEHTAVRPGVLYTGTGHATAELPAGKYTVYASRGMEWSRAMATLELDRESTGVPLLRFDLVHEIKTPGFIAADTHIHTLTHSGHGDASVEERQITLAAEGVELAIATDHNHNTDYGAAQHALGLSEYYTAVVGNEVTTPIGHFNAFPLDPKDTVPEHDSHDLAEMIQSMRDHGARTVIWNHPRWPEGEKSPVVSIGLDSRTGFWKGDWAFGYDAMELVNSDTHEPNPMQLYRDWFSFLNRGQRVFSVGASDSHEVGVVVGQGRTYVKSSSTDVANLNVEECCDNIAQGHSSVSMGIFVDLMRNGESIMGESVWQTGGWQLRVAAPSWVTPKRLTLFVNGEVAYTHPLERPTGADAIPFDVLLSLEPLLKIPDHDYWVVAVVEGEKVTEPFWPLRNDYTLGSTNPVFVDTDGDGMPASALQIAEWELKEHGTSEDAVLSILSRVDGAVAAQVMRLVRAQYRQQAEERIHNLEEKAVESQPSHKGWIGE